MSWQAYQVVLRLRSPLHIGAGRVSYLQRARPYVTGRALRGALVSRVVRNQPELLSGDPLDPYRCVSKTFAQFMAFTYFYPALQNGTGWSVYFPWEDQTGFRCRFLSSYAATALEYPLQTAAEGLLYETEFLSPYTLDSGEPVFLMGYIFVEEERLKAGKYDWKGALCRLQLGGERSYGWGDARLEMIGECASNNLFDIKDITFHLEGRRPMISLKREMRVLAHTEANGAFLRGDVEPMVGREWRADNQEKNISDRTHVGQHLAYNGVYFAPGSVVLEEKAFVIGEGGYWLQQERDA